MKYVQSLSKAYNIVHYINGHVLYGTLLVLSLNTSDCHEIEGQFYVQKINNGKHLGVTILLSIDVHLIRSENKKFFSFSFLYLKWNDKIHFFSMYVVLVKIVSRNIYF